MAADDGAIAVLQLWLAERARLGFNGRQKLFCTLDGGPLSSRVAALRTQMQMTVIQLQGQFMPAPLKPAVAPAYVLPGLRPGS